jgi:hypothetical protein
MQAMRRRMIGLLLWASVCVLHGCADPVEEPREQTDEPRSGQGDGKRDVSTKGERAEEAVQLADPHHHLVDVHTQPWDVDIAPDGRLVWVDPPPKDRLSDVVVNPAGTVRAYVVEKAWIGDMVRDHIQIEYLDSGKVFEIEGLPVEYRLYSDLTWVGDRYLVFDRWSQPHYGLHYVVDVVELKLVLVRGFPDQLYLDSQRGGRSPAK